MNHNRYEMDKLNEMNRKNVARMMEQYGAPVRKKRSVFRLSLRALLALIPNGWQRLDGRLFRDTVR
jgi:transposase